MFSLLLCIGALIRLFRSRGNLILENLVLGQQLAVLKRRPRRLTIGLLFWVLVFRCWSGWKRAHRRLSRNRSPLAPDWLSYVLAADLQSPEAGRREPQQGSVADPWETPHARF